MFLQPKRDGVSLNVVLAVSPVMGVVAFLIYPCTMNHHVFYCFLRLLVLPALASGSRKFIMVDNHSSHKMPHIRNLVTDNGHVYQFRPTHSPDFAPVELCFAQIKSFMKANENHVRSANLVEWATLAVNSISTDQIKRYYAHSHYLVTGEPFKPYTGWQ